MIAHLNRGINGNLLAAPGRVRFGVERLHPRAVRARFAVLSVHNRRVRGRLAEQMFAPKPVQDRLQSKHLLAAPDGGRSVVLSVHLQVVVGRPVEQMFARKPARGINQGVIRGVPNGNTEASHPQSPMLDSGGQPRLCG